MQEQIKSELKKSMIEKNMERVNVIRMLMASFTNELVSLGRVPTDVLSDEEVLKVLKREVKKRRDSIDQYTNANRPELAEDEKAEMIIIEEFLPEMMSKEEITKRISEKLTNEPIDISKKGQFMGMLMKELGNTADASIVKEILDELIK